MTDQEQLKAEVAWLHYGRERMNLALRERNTVSNEEDTSEARESESKDETGREREVGAHGEERGGGWSA